MSTNAEIAARAISVLDSIEQALEDVGVEVPQGTDAEVYASLIKSVPQSGNYELLSNKPQIGGVTLLGDKKLNELGLNRITNSEIEAAFQRVMGG